MTKKIVVVFSGILFLVTIFGFDPVIAASPNISNSYNANEAIPNGSLVSLVASSPGTVEPANASNAQRLVGIVEDSNESLLAVNPTSSKVQVATDGNVDALVSTVNGNIGVGQQIAVSPFNGVGMKASSGDRVIGTAETSFSSNTYGAAQEQVTDSNGKTHSVDVGYVKLTIAIGTSSGGNSSVQNFQQFIESITGHQASLFRIVISLIIAVIAILTIVTLIYASIYGSIISVGRNPLAKFTIFRTLTSVVTMVVVLAIVALVTMYLLLY